jgi:hypothetical protein
MIKKPTDNARQFLTAPLFKTYDAILGLVKYIEKERKKKGLWRDGEPLIFTGSAIRLAKKNDTDNHTEGRHIQQLVADGWLIKIAGQRRPDGSFGTKQYRVVLVDEWLTTHPDWVKKSRKKNNALRVPNARRHLKKIGIPVETGIDAVVLLGEPLVPWYPVEQNTSLAVEQNTSTAVEQNTSPESPAVARDTSATVAQDTSTAVAQNTPMTVAHDSSRKLVSLPVDSSAHTHAQKAGVREDSLEDNTFDQVAKYLPIDMLSSQWKYGEEERLDALIREHGWKKFVAVARLYWQEQPASFSNTIFKWTSLIKGFSGYLSKPELAPMMNEQERQRETKTEEWQRRQAESIERQTRELVAKRDRKPLVPVNEVDGAEFFKDWPED